ncbi:hypothetical protein SAMN04487771_10628 [[Clostridium] aminophilum]|uniref:Uncharacterized protein n=1 Tax=[Clostridium] aminophilum TaxID=1526 RepID=A0A1I0I0Y8_9FIRM|nr:hypothetical protein [[Clostridium] aminophilum]SET89313.1 hypothetical protein SAMN04487771_10628 [[Clostridium] aminophilum]
MVEKMSFGEPFFEVYHIWKEEEFRVPRSGILVNVSEDQPIGVEREYFLKPFRTLKVADVCISVPGSAILISGEDALDLEDLKTLDSIRSIWKSNWEMTHDEKQRGVPFYKSPKAAMGNVRANFVLVADPGFPSGIHREHEVPLRELHVQIVGAGAMDMLHENDPETVYASLPMISGGVHDTMWDEEGIYPWHRYRSITRSVFLVIEVR